MINYSIKIRLNVLNYIYINDLVVLIYYFKTLNLDLIDLCNKIY